MAKTQDYAFGEFTFPRGWFMIADASELKDSPLAVRFFGNDFALYRGQSGRVVLLDAYCPHMGTHLAQGGTSYVVQDGLHIDGDSIRCPYHNWRFGSDGRCNHIPYFNGPIPKNARVKSWPVIERYGCIFVWHDPEGGEPDYDFPTIEEWGDPAWVRWKLDDLGTLNVHPIEVVDNMADVRHLGPIHGSTVEYFENVFERHVCIQYQGGGHRTMVGSDKMLETDTWYMGPGLLFSRIRGAYDALQLIMHTPIEDGVIKAWQGLIVKSAHEVASEEDVAIARACQETSRLALVQDFEIWANKRPAFQFLQLPNDGPIHKVRTWYRQFYHPKDRAAEFWREVEGVHTVRGVAPAPQKRLAGLLAGGN